MSQPQARLHWTPSLNNQASVSQAFMTDRNNGWRSWHKNQATVMTSLQMNGRGQTRRWFFQDWFCGDEARRVSAEQTVPERVVDWRIPLWWREIWRWPGPDDCNQKAITGTWNPFPIQKSVGDLLNGLGRLQSLAFDLRVYLIPVPAWLGEAVLVNLVFCLLELTEKYGDRLGPYCLKWSLVCSVDIWQRVLPFTWQSVFTSSYFCQVGHISTCFFTTNFSNSRLYKLSLQ